MPRRFYRVPQLYDALKAEGYVLPDECADVEMTLPVDGVMQLKLIVNLTGESLQQFGRALVAIGAAQRDDVPVTQFKQMTEEDAIAHANALLAQHGQVTTTYTVMTDAAREALQGLASKEAK